MKQVNWKEILLFFILATLISAPFRLNWITPQNSIQLPWGLNIFFYVLRGIGPLIACLLIFSLFKSKVPKPDTFFGKDRVASMIAISVIPIGLTLTGVPNAAGLNERYFGFIYGLMLVMYALGEEYGWRGYLQQALEPLATPWRIVAVALIWYLWHLNFLVAEVPLRSHVIHFLALVLGSWGLLHITLTTRSILFAAAVHLSFNILSDVKGDFTGRLYILIVAVVVWVILIRYMKAKSVVVRS